MDPANKMPEGIAAFVLVRRLMVHLVGSGHLPKARVLGIIEDSISVAEGQAGEPAGDLLRRFAESVETLPGERAQPADHHH